MAVVVSVSSHAPNKIPPPVLLYTVFPNIVLLLTLISAESNPLAHIKIPIHMSLYRTCKRNGVNYEEVILPLLKGDTSEVLSLLSLEKGEPPPYLNANDVMFLVLNFAII